MLDVPFWSKEIYQAHTELATLTIQSAYNIRKVFTMWRTVASYEGMLLWRGRELLELLMVSAFSSSHCRLARSSRSLLLSLCMSDLQRTRRSTIRSGRCTELYFYFLIISILSLSPSSMTGLDSTSGR